MRLLGYSGNRTHCQSPKVLKQAAHEFRQSQQLTQDNVKELQIQMEAWRASIPGKIAKGFIQSLSIAPFHVISYTERHLELFVNANDVIRMCAALRQYRDCC